VRERASASKTDYITATSQGRPYLLGGLGRIRKLRRKEGWKKGPRSRVKLAVNNKYRRPLQSPSLTRSIRIGKPGS